MNSTQTKNQIVSAYTSVNWDRLTKQTEQTVRLIWLTFELLTMVAVLLVEAIYEHREQIREFLVKATAVAVVSVEATYRAGCATRRFLAALSDRSAELAPSQPVATLAPITAPLEAFQEVMEKVLARAFPELFTTA